MAKKPPKDVTGDAAGESNAATDQPASESAAQARAPAGMAITVNAQYTKDLSFEVPGAPGVYSTMQGAQPEIAVNINVSAKPLKEKTFEVVLEIRADCKIKEQTAFILELQYAGVFTLSVPDEHVQPILLIECPRLLFPFARNILADVSRDGGFPALFLGMVDFASMYQTKLQELQKNASGAAIV
ncbi:MAG: protein-export chaperone SecB [Rhodospirillales bacterium]